MSLRKISILLLCLMPAVLRADVFYAAAAAGAPPECTPGTNTLVVNLLAQSGSTANAGTYASPSFTPSTNATIFAFMSGSPTGTQTVTNTGSTQLTWWEARKTNYNTLGSPAGFLSVWVAQLPQGTAPFSMTVVCNQTSGTGRNFIIAEVTGADQTAANGTNAVVQAVGGGADASANPTNKFAAPGNAGFNTILFAVGDDINNGNDSAATLSWTELWETNYNTPAHALALYYSNAVPSSVVTATNTASSRDWATIALEVMAGTNCITPGGDITFSSVSTSNQPSPTTGLDQFYTFTQTESITDGYVIATTATWDNVVGVSNNDEPEVTNVLWITASTTNSMTQITNSWFVPSFDGTSRIYFWGIPVGSLASGSYTIQVQWEHAGTDRQGTYVGMSYKNVHQSVSTGNVAAASNQSSSTPSVTVSSATGEMVLDATVHFSGAQTAGAGQTERWDNNGDTDGSGTEEAGASSVTMDRGAAVTDWLILGMTLKPL